MKKVWQMVILAMVCLAVFASQVVAGTWEAEDSYVQYRTYLSGSTKFSAGVKVWDKETGYYPDGSAISSIELWYNGQKVPAVFEENWHFTIFGSYDVNEGIFRRSPWIIDVFWTATINWEDLPEGKYIFKVKVDGESLETSSYFCGKKNLPPPGKFLESWKDDEGGLYVFFESPIGFPDEGGLQIKVYAETHYPGWVTSLLTIQDKLPGHMGMIYYPPSLVNTLKFWGLSGLDITLYTRDNNNTARAYAESFRVSF